MNSDSFACRFRFWLSSLNLSERRHGRDSAVAPLRPLRERDIELHEVRGGERCVANRESLNDVPGLLSSVSDGDQVGEYLDWLTCVQPSNERVTLK